jgi:hypothetical protein
VARSHGNHRTTSPRVRTRQSLLWTHGYGKFEPNLVDDTSTAFEQNRKSWQASLQSLILEQQQQQQQLLELRFLYIPTAMYALRKDSNNSPGKQRQRARADGKKRRNEIVNLLNKKLGEKVNVLTVTLELEEGSIKQPDGSEDPSKFPANGEEAWEDWKPKLSWNLRMKRLNSISATMYVLRGAIQNHVGIIICDPG